MTTPSKPVSSPAALLEDAILDDIIGMSVEEATEELREVGSSPEAALSRVKAAIDAATSDCARRRMDEAKAGVAAFRSQVPGTVSLDERRAQARRLTEMMSRGPSVAGMTMAARKSEGLSDRDEEGLLEDLADLERLEREDDEGSRR